MAKSFLPKLQFPKFLLVLVFTESWERFSYYSMKFILSLYMTSEMHLSDQYALGVSSLFNAIGYLIPILTGILADSFFGFRVMIFIGGSIITLGHFILALSAFTDVFYFWGLGCVALGTGFFKGNITNLLGSSYDKEKHLHRLSGFTLFYAGVNLGGFVASISSSYISYFVSYHLAFSIAGFGMIIGLISFSFYNKIFLDKDILRKPEIITRKLFLFITWPILLAILGLVCTVPLAFIFYFAEALAEVNLVLYLGIIIFVVLISIIFFLKDTRERKNYITLLVYFIFLMVFFSFELQLDGIFTLFTERNVNRDLGGGVEFPPSMIVSINPACIMIAGFLLSLIKVSSKWDNLRVFLSLVSNTGCFLILYWGTLVADTDTALTSLFFPLFGILVMAIGEVLMSPLIQSATTHFAPKKMRGLMMGIYMAMLGFAGLTGFLFADIFEVPTNDQGKVLDPFESLEIYKKGFYEVGLYNLIFIAAFIICLPLLYWLQKPTSAEKQNLQNNNFEVQINS